MLDPKRIRDNPQLIKDAVRKKCLDVDVDAYLRLEEQSRNLRTEWEAVRAEQKKCGAAIGQLQDSKREEALVRLSELKKKLKEFETTLPDLEAQRDELAARLPEPPADEVPEGKDDTENIELSKVGEPREFDFEPLDHLDLLKRHDLCDIERAVKISGSRTYFLKNEAVILEQSLMRMGIDFLRERGFNLMSPPVFVRKPAMYGTAYFPGGEDQAYALERDESWLVGTSEVPVASYHSDEFVDLDNLPLRYAGLSNCFRREAGAAGKDTRGLYRIHQFTKVEQVVICKNDEDVSKAHHQEILKNAEDFLQLLELPYRVVNVCGGDLGQGQVQKYDIETWMPSRNSYGETHSASRFHEFQARRLNTRYKTEEGSVYCHTLNNTLVASPRILIPLIETHQNQDGSITIPKALRPYTGFDKIG